MGQTLHRADIVEGDPARPQRAPLPDTVARLALAGTASLIATLFLWWLLTMATGAIAAARFPSPAEFRVALQQISIEGYAGGTLLTQAWLRAFANGQ